MIRKLTLDFKDLDIEEYLFPRIPVKFQGTDPREFEDFIAHIFTINGYALEQASYSPDFGADLIVDYEGERTAVQVKRYHESHKIGVQEIKQLVGATDYYQCDHGMMITTSSYDRTARTLAEDEKIILWDWHRLHQAIADTFLEGDYHDYFQRYPVVSEPTNADLALRLMSIDLSRPKLSLDSKTTIYAELENKSDTALRVYCDLPIYITHHRRQFTARAWAPDSFQKGEIFGKAVVQVAFTFNNKQLSKYHRHDRIILRVHSIMSGEVIELEQKLKNLKKECFLITFSFGRESEAYQNMIDFRDEVLSTNRLGRYFIMTYYAASRHLVNVLSSIPLADRGIRPLLSLLVRVCTGWLKKNRKKKS